MIPHLRLRRRGQEFPLPAVVSNTDSNAFHYQDIWSHVCCFYEILSFRDRLSVSDFVWTQLFFISDEAARDCHVRLGVDSQGQKLMALHSY